MVPYPDAISTKSIGDGGRKRSFFFAGEKYLPEYVIASAAKQSCSPQTADCFVASLLAMTKVSDMPPDNRPLIGITCQDVKLIVVR